MRILATSCHMVLYSQLSVCCVCRCWECPKKQLRCVKFLSVSVGFKRHSATTEVGLSLLVSRRTSRKPSESWLCACIPTKILAIRSVKSVARGCCGQQVESSQINVPPACRRRAPSFSPCSGCTPFSATLKGALDSYEPVTE